MQWSTARLARWAEAFLLKHWLPLCFLVATLIALTAPAPGRAVVSVTVLDDIHVVQSVNIIIVFIISGLTLSTADVKRAFRYWPGIAYGFTAILAITPCLGFALRALPLTPPEFAVGLTVFAAVPTTLGVGEALVRASGGNAALALLLLVGTNAVGVLTMPVWLKALLNGVEGLSASVDALSLLLKLLVTVLAPALAGKALRELVPPVGRFATRHKQPLGMLSTVQLALIIWQTLSAAQDVLVHQAFLDIFVVICCAVIMHAVYLTLNFAITLYVMRMPLKEAIAATIMSSQKSAPVAVTAISYLTSNTTEQGLLAVPCIVGQLAQIFMGAAFAPYLKRRVKEQDVRADVATAAQAEDAAAGTQLDVLESGGNGSSSAHGSQAADGEALKDDDKRLPPAGSHTATGAELDARLPPAGEGSSPVVAAAASSDGHGPAGHAGESRPGPA